MFFRKTLNANEIYDLAGKAASAAMTGCRMGNEKTLMETANSAQEIAFHTIMFRQGKNRADKRGDNRDEAYPVDLGCSSPSFRVLAGLRSPQNVKQSIN